MGFPLDVHHSAGAESDRSKPGMDADAEHAATGAEVGDVEGGR
jgi:hypothetical protein